MPEDQKISKRNAEIECIDLGENFLRPNPKGLKKFRKMFQLPRINMRRKK
jgi:hypothetical protein